MTNTISFVAARTAVALTTLACAVAVAGCHTKNTPADRSPLALNAAEAARGVSAGEAIPADATPVEAQPKPATLPPLSGANAKLGAAQPKLATSVFSVTGMKDPKAAAAIEAALIKLPGVTTVSADNVSARAKVQYDPAKLTCAQLIAAMKKLGLTAKLEPAESDCCAGGGKSCDGGTCQYGDAGGEGV